MRIIVFFLIISATLVWQACSSKFSPQTGNHHPPSDLRQTEGELYFPDVSKSLPDEKCDSSSWEYISAAEAGFDEQKLNQVIDFIAERDQHTTAFVVLYKGKIIREWYAGNIDLDEYNSTVNTGQLQQSNWDCNTADRIHSTTKSIVSLTIGIAQEEGLLSLNEPVGQYLGKWTDLPQADEDLIKIKHLLTMTSGLDGAPAGGGNFETPDGRIKGIPQGADFQKPATAWFYNTTAYHRLFEVIEKVGQDKRAYIKEKIFDRIGMNDSVVLNQSVASSARDMARFGLLVLSQGKWNNDTIVSPSFIQQATSSYLNLPDFSGLNLDKMNPSYGFLFWLNGKSSWKSGQCFNNLGELKDSQFCMEGESAGKFNGPLIPEAAQDLIAALGLGDKKIYIVPSLDLVIARHGNPPKGSAIQFAESSLDLILWQKLMSARNE
ncbi:MAG: beta-lactamase family protein [Bdellovibrionales bacterium]|nr:beta-lactamase family protein [Bdellovibrionales bacterium]